MHKKSDVFFLAQHPTKEKSTHNLRCITTYAISMPKLKATANDYGKACEKYARKRYFPWGEHLFGMWIA